MEIVKFEESKQPTFLQALNGHVVKVSKPEDVAAAVSASIEKAWFDLGLKAPADKKDKEFLKDGVIAEIYACFSTLTIDEIKAAIYHGARGRYGEVFGLNVIGIAKWFAAYMTDQARIEAKAELKALSEPVKREPTPEELAKLTHDIIINAFEKFKQNGSYNDYANIIYDELVGKKVIAFTPERKKEFMQQAIREAFDSKNPLRGRSSQEISAFRKASDKLLESQNAGTITKDAAIISDAKRIALNTFFKELVDIDQDIQDLLQN